MQLLASAARFFRVDPTLDLHGRLYQAICLVVVFFGIVVVPAVNLSQQLPFVVTLIAVSAGVVSLVLHRVARHGRQYPTVLFLSVLVASDLAWFPNAGSLGSVVFYLPAVALVPVVFEQGTRRAALVAMVFVSYIALLGLEWMRPSLVTPYAAAGGRYADLATGFAVSLAAAVVIVRLVITEYRAERQRLEVTVAALAESREMLACGLQEAAQARAQLRTLIDSTDDLVWLAEARECRLTLFNRAFEQSMGARTGLAIRPGLTPEDMLPAAEAAVWRAVHQRVLAEGSVRAEQTTPDGRIVLVSSHRIETEGAVIGVSVFVKDITDRIRAREDRARLEQHLMQAQKLESLGSLAGGVAHDYNNMLAGILGHADLLLESETDPSRREALGAIVTAATRSGELTRKLLAFARRGKNIVEATDLRELAVDSIAMLRPSLHPQLDAEMSLDGEWTVDGDPSQLQQVVVNLCINAAEAMPHGGTLRLTTRDTWIDGDEAAERQLLPGAYVELRVDDTGIGMTEDTARRVFEPFFTTKSGAERAGTGLGLATVYGVVQLHRGAVWLTSSPGRGTRVTVLLPRGTLERTVAAPAAIRNGSGVVLVADDEQLLRDFMTAALGRLGYGVITAPDGEAAVALYRDRHHELEGVLLDLKMPKKNGHDAFVAMRAIDSSVPVLICSGYGDNEEAQTLISLGAAGLLAKPFKIAELAAQLASLGARPLAHHGRECRSEAGACS